jgi:hypothetical protein
MGKGTTSKCYTKKKKSEMQFLTQLSADVQRSHEQKLEVSFFGVGLILCEGARRGKYRPVLTQYTPWHLFRTSPLHT